MFPEYVRVPRFEKSDKDYYLVTNYLYPELGLEHTMFAKHLSINSITTLELLCSKLGIGLTWTTWDAGFALEEARHTVRATGPLDAVAIGLQSSWKFLTETARVLKGLVLGNVGSSNVGGIITIGVVSHSFAEYGLAKFFFFLCILSLNLAFLNVLPIPALDGGHAVFVIVEMITGKAPSTRILEVAQTIGFFLLLALLLYANGNDILRALE
jgi:regulator of sigma E protease